jgi:serpin B
MKLTIMAVLILLALAFSIWPPKLGQAQGEPPARNTNLKLLVEGNTIFACDLYQRLSEKPGNIVFSPYSISAALAMTYAGARADTETQMAKVLHFNMAQADLPPTFKVLSSNFTNVAPAPEYLGIKPGDEYSLNIANALWGQQGYQFRPSYLTLTEENYGAGLHPVDFRQPETARQTINAWVDKQTNGKILDLIGKGALTPDMRLVLTNAIYFRDHWLHQFNKEASKPAPFTTLDNKVVSVPMMYTQEHFRYARGTGWQAVELPYQQSRLAMLIIVPDLGKFGAFEKNLSAVQLREVAAKLASKEVRLALPKFKYDFNAGLGDTLKALGMTQAFQPDAADFSGIAGKPGDLFIADVLHKAIIGVDETGTEAAAATAVMMAATAMPMPQEIVNLTIDRSFIYAIRDPQTGTLLFLGRVVNPK